MVTALREFYWTPDIAALLDAVKLLLNDIESDLIRICPYCGSAEIIKFGHKYGKQRFFCKHCGRTFIPTTHTVMSNAHYPKNVWDAAILYTLGGDSISFAADNLGMSHNAMFQMRHKILTALQETAEFRTVCLGDVTELNGTFVPDCYKGKLGNAGQKPRNETFPMNICASAPT